jgi:LysR family transcriptional regulator, regulator for bpeEF and oprC
MEYLSRLPLFIRVAKLGSFASVAREMDMTPSAVSKQIQRLESELGVRLFQRTTRKLALTDDGQRFFEKSAELIEGLQLATDEVRDRRNSIAGRLKISVPIALLEAGLADALASFASDNPDLELDVEGNERMVDMLDEGIDVAIRVGELDDSSLVARNLAPAPMWMVASPKFVETFGLPQSPSDYAEAPMASYAGHGKNLFQFSKDGQWVEQQFHGRLKGNHGAFLKQLAQADLGFCMAPQFLVETEVASGQLVRLLADWTVEPQRNIWAVYPHRQHLPSRVRALIDHLVDWFQG